MSQVQTATTWIGVAAAGVSGAVMVLSIALRLRSRERLAAIERGTPAAERIVANAVSSFGDDVKDLGKVQRYKLAYEEIQKRDKRHARALYVMLGLSIIVAATAISITLILHSDPTAKVVPSGLGSGSSAAPPVTLDQQRSRCLESNDARQCYEVGVTYWDRHEDDLAAQYFHYGCIKGSALACAYLGTSYEDGRGHPQDYSVAALLYEKACDDREWYGCAALGRLYAKGAGRPYDIKYAKKLFVEACQNGEPKGCDFSQYDWEAKHQQAMSSGSDAHVSPPMSATIVCDKDKSCNAVLSAMKPLLASYKSCIKNVHGPADLIVTSTGNVTLTNADETSAADTRECITKDFHSIRDNACECFFTAHIDNS
ncbi:MAG: sel1 repeat family protein [Deltaproteobacteria bacterium]|nr:sel1 repeat family protein [Deltaproteobacteria bacterium]